MYKELLKYEKGKIIIDNRLGGHEIEIEPSKRELLESKAREQGVSEVDVILDLMQRAETADTFDLNAII